MKTLSCLLLLLILVAGCGQSPESARSDAFFADWFRQHGDTNIVTDSDGVGIEGNQTRFHASLYGTKQFDSGYNVEVEFKIKLPEGGPIVEYVAGTGKTKDDAYNEAMANFVLTTIHVIYKAFINPDDSHQRAKSITINGQARQMFAGNMIQMGEQGADPLDLDAISAQTQNLVAALPLGSGPHWAKLIYSQHHNKPMVVSANLDNNDSAEGTDALNKLPWPQRDQFYMVKQFIVIK